MAPLGRISAPGSLLNSGGLVVRWCQHQCRPSRWPLSLPLHAGRRIPASPSPDDDEFLSLRADLETARDEAAAAAKLRIKADSSAAAAADLETTLDGKLAEIDSLRAELEAARKEAATVAELRAEIDTRTAVVAQLQAQLASTISDLERLSAELEVARTEAAAAAQLRAEVDARTAAMANLQAQLDTVEKLRADELASAMARFEELENTLSLAESSMDAESERFEALEAKVARLESDLEAAAHAAEELRAELYGAQRAEREASDAAHAAQQEAAAARQAVIEEAIKTGEVLEKAEALAMAVAERLNLLEGTDSEVDSEGEEEEGDLMGVSKGVNMLSEADAEALLDELDLLRGELEAELQATEDEAARADAAEADAAALRQQLAALASAGDDGANAMGGFSQSLVQELAAARAAAASAAAEAEALRTTVAGLETQIKTIESQKVQSKALGFAGGNSALTQAMERIKELESEATRREASLAEGRAFLATILKQHGKTKAEEKADERVQEVV